MKITNIGSVDLIFDDTDTGGIRVSIKAGAEVTLRDEDVEKSKSISNALIAGTVTNTGTDEPLTGTAGEDAQGGIAAAAGAAQADIDAHVALVSGNPHVVTKAEVGLGSADDTSDADKPVSTATGTALGLKADDADLTTHTGDTANPHTVTKAQVGLTSADDTSDADKPVSTAQATAIGLKALKVAGALSSPTAVDLTTVIALAEEMRTKIDAMNV